jgi:hypothetical protein
MERNGMKGVALESTEAHLLVTCPKCGRQWMPPCEQVICIERHGECIPCRFVPVGGEINKHGSGEGTTEEIDAISAAAKVGADSTAHNAKAVGLDAAGGQSHTSYGLCPDVGNGERN